MKLSKKEKQELLQDAANHDRKKAFQKIKKTKPLSLDGYIQFLNIMQGIFPKENSSPQHKIYQNQKL